MSRFITAIPTELIKFLQSLPKGSTIEGLMCNILEENMAGQKTLNTTEGKVAVIWSNDKWESGLTVPVDYPLEMMVRGKQPKTVKTKKQWHEGIKDLNIVEESEAVKEITKPVSIIHYLTQSEFDEARKNNEPLEFHGIYPAWKRVAATDKFVEGYFYRKAQPNDNTTPPVREMQPANP